MFKNYLLTAWRNLMRRKLFSLINIFGLAIGLTTCLVLLKYVVFEQSFDRFHEKGDRIYRVVNERLTKGGKTQLGTITYAPVGPTLQKDYPEVERYTRMQPWGRVLLQNNNEIFPVEDCLLVDEYFLSMFTFPFLAGDLETALKEKFSIILTQSEADRIFGVGDGDYSRVLDKTLKLDRIEQPFRVTGVCQDLPQNSLLNFNVLLSFNTLTALGNSNLENNWTWSDFHHFVELQPGANAEELEAKLAAFSDRYFKGDEVTGGIEKFYLQPLFKAHLHSANFEYELGQVGNNTIVWALLIVGLMVLIIAWVNYINLSTVRAFERAKEVGIRKVLGSSRGQLVWQFMAEAFVFNGISLGIALILNEIISPYFNQVLGVDFTWASLMNGGIWITYYWLGLLLVFLLGVFFSGVYPAFIMSAYQTLTVLQGKFKNSQKGNILRKFLVGFQFAASIAFIAGTFVAYQQIKYLQEKDLGLDIQETLVIRSPELSNFDSTYIERTTNLKEQLLQNSQIKSVATSTRLPGDRLGRTFDLCRLGAPEEEQYMTSTFGIDYNFIENYDISLLAGRNFKATDHSPEFAKINTVLVNESAVELLGFEKLEEALGQKVVFWGEKQWEIIGVVSDFHQESLHAAIESIVFQPFYSTNGYISLKIAKDDIEETIAKVGEVYASFFPNNAFDYFFLDDRYNRQYQADFSFGKLLAFLAALAILIACLGLFGLISFAAVLRAKEIGVRKVLGASVMQLFALLTKDFARLLGISLLIAIPITYYSIQQWLNGFVYRIEVHWSVFILASLVVLVIALASVGFRSYLAASRNPVESLRDL